MHKLYLSRRNIQSLLNKLDRVASGDFSACTIIKRDNQHAKYPQTMESCVVTAVEVGISVSPENVTIDRERLNHLLQGLEAFKGTTTQHGITIDDVLITALEDGEYYDTREPGEIHHLDDPGIRR